jgi:ribonuclease G
MPFSGACGVSRIIEGASERERLKYVVRSLTISENIGIVIHTAGEGKQAHCVVRDLHMVLKHRQVIVGKINAPDLKLILLYQESSLIERTVRDCLTEEVDRILVDNPEDFKLAVLTNRSRKDIA